MATSNHNNKPKPCINVQGFLFFIQKGNIIMSKRFDTKDKHYYHKYNTDTQYYKNVPLKLIVYTENHFARLRAKRYNINNTVQNVWIPNCYLEPDGTIKSGVTYSDIEYQSFLLH